MLSVQQAEQIILTSIQPLDPQRNTEIVYLLAASGRILAQEITSQLDFPHWDNSAMDGYAVRHADVAESNAENPATLEIIEEIPAGKAPQKTIQPGQAARIFTGAMMPAGADTVVMQEVTQRSGNSVTILNAPAPQSFVRHKGSFSPAGTPLLSPGISIGATEIAVLASAQCTQIPVYRRPVVAILSTGDELVTPDRPLKPGQLVDSNQYALATLVRQTGAIPQMLGIIPDDPQQLQNAISQALEFADMVISSGGVSVGEYDFVDQILSSLGGEIQIRAIAVKPGKPLTFATFSSSSRQAPIIYFGLPGNPVSSLVTFWRFVQPAIKKLSGISDFWQPMFVQAKTQHSLKSDGKRESYFWGKLHLVNGEYEFTLAGGSQSSGNLINLAQTNGLAVLPVGKTLINARDLVQVLQVR
ncbi:molybdopterin molybdotransferase MoeA [Phormidium sp. LEGE 05292]|uniref:molybdopterin molybdotransferase MoeA n=1 Tax=[Phormidium] sp. LEGE 05292 TaxID=767427 RepID=UPI00187EE4B4|nr:gephyrin-like molybdotransferase Glp [Phormidium sp. LEGE 05292]MBE9229397.1 molybdopterin molybdotransferase MoeA [Phormidium sp. LEGE 05292]